MLLTLLCYLMFLDLDVCLYFFLSIYPSGLTVHNQNILQYPLR